MTRRVVLACAPELDLPAVINGLTGSEVVAVAVDLGQGGVHLAATREQALAAGAVAAVAIDAREELAQHYCLPALLANALTPVLSRPLLARHLVTAARQHNASTIALHRADPAFTTEIAALAPDLEVITWPEHPTTQAEQSIWHRRPARIPSQTGPRDPDELTLTFDQGVPVAIDGETVTVLQAIQELNRRAGAHGVGRIHQAPGATTLITAHQALEHAVLEPDLAEFKREVERRWTELVQDGRWSSPLKDALDDFVLGTQEQVSGEVRLVLHGGRAVIDQAQLWDFEKQGV
ncbi:argininosuccinate synthase [Crossiella sp. SN42]|uniref:argininosuccinate synthase domain-containing protein n=1 Tax=Crossiella sp. SN42 TaxID=2944808 RepID=UPI00207CBCFB|nr:argininosuccinate synthase domain-containing protein [Crossiella sp. SN42]MCO1581767.1 argininosuccinate synthase [Crossiella sp. SN42]